MLNAVLTAGLDEWNAANSSSIIANAAPSMFRSGPYCKEFKKYCRYNAQRGFT